MFGIGGFNPISLLATTAFGPAGGIISQLAMQVFSQFGQQLLQNLGQQAGLPQSDIEMAQAHFSARVGDTPGTVRNLSEALQQFGRETGASPAQIGDAERQFQKMLLKQAADAMETEEAKDAKAGGKGGRGWLRALAEALGRSADKVANQLERDAKKLDGATPSESAEYSADAQAFSMLMNAINTAIKSIGESLGAMAKRQ